MINYDDLKVFVQVVAKVDSVENAVAEIYRLQKENLISEKEEEELYQLADPEEIVEIPAKEYDNGSGNVALYNLANGTATLVDAMRELVK